LDRFENYRIPPVRAARYQASGFWSSETCNDVLDARARMFGDRVVLSDARRRMTYRELASEVERTARWFAGLGMGPADVVTIQLPNVIEFAVAFFAVQRVGAIASQIGIDFRVREVEPIMQLCESSFFVCPDRYKGFDYPGMVQVLRESLPRLCAICVFDQDGGMSAIRIRESAAAPDARPVEAPGDANAVTRMALTSGTTGNPKSILLSHNSILSACRICNVDMTVTERDVFLIYLPLGLTWGYHALIQAILAGGRAVLMESFNAEATLEIIQRERATFIFTAPGSIVSMLNVSDRGRFDTSSLRILGTGGASCPIEVLREARGYFGGRLCEFYGMAEVGYMSYTRPDDDPDLVCGTVGRVSSAMSVRIVDDAGNDVPLGHSGEIVADGPSINLGYYRNEQATKAAHTPDGWFRTGDVGTIDAAGNIRIVGRIKEIINRGGKKFYPREVEELLYTHPKVLHAAIVAVPDKRLGERNCLCVVPQPGVQIALAEMVAHLRDQVAIYKLPEMIEIFEELPMTPSGKVQRPALSRLVLERWEHR
jgi:non-ribosomal peptide synthetase component E (peptide arylation enzyme)